MAKISHNDFMAEYQKYVQAKGGKYVAYEFRAAGLGSNFISLANHCLFCLHNDFQPHINSDIWNKRIRRREEFRVSDLLILNVPESHFGNNRNTVERYKLHVRNLKRKIVNRTFWIRGLTAKLSNMRMIGGLFRFQKSISKPITHDGKLKRKLANPPDGIIHPMKKDHHYFPELGIDCGYWAAIGIIYRGIFRFTPKMQAHADAKKAELGFEDAPYIAIHIRRGDKRTEVEHAQTSDYIAKLDEINVTGITNIFLASDDYDAVQDFVALAPKGLNIKTFCKETSRGGYSQYFFDKQLSASRFADTMDLLAEIDIMRNADDFIGTFTSNIGRTVSFLRPTQETHSIKEDTLQKIQKFYHHRTDNNKDV